MNWKRKIGFKDFLLILYLLIGVVFTNVFMYTECMAPVSDRNIQYSIYVLFGGEPTTVGGNILVVVGFFALLIPMLFGVIVFGIPIAITASIFSICDNIHTCGSCQTITIVAPIVSLIEGVGLLCYFYPASAKTIFYYLLLAFDYARNTISTPKTEEERRQMDKNLENIRQEMNSLTGTMGGVPPLPVELSQFKGTIQELKFQAQTYIRTMSLAKQTEMIAGMNGLYTQMLNLEEHLYDISSIADRREMRRLQHEFDKKKIELETRKIDYERTRVGN